MPLFAARATLDELLNGPATLAEKVYDFRFIGLWLGTPCCGKHGVNIDHVDEFAMFLAGGEL